MFLRELALYLDYFGNQMAKRRLGLSPHPPAHFHEFKENLLRGIEHCRHVTEEFAAPQRDRFLTELESLREDVDRLPVLCLPAYHDQPLNQRQ